MFNRDHLIDRKAIYALANGGQSIALDLVLDEFVAAVIEQCAFTVEYQGKTPTTNQVAAELRATVPAFKAYKAPL
jgi:hypothetical protein